MHENIKYCKTHKSQMPLLYTQEVNSIIKTKKSFY